MPPKAADDRRSRHGRNEQREEQEEDKKRDVGWIGKKIELLLDLDSNRSLRRRIISVMTRERSDRDGESAMSPLPQTHDPNRHLQTLANIECAHRCHLGSETAAIPPAEIRDPALWQSTTKVGYRGCGMTSKGQRLRKDTLAEFRNGVERAVSCANLERVRQFALKKRFLWGMSSQRRATRDTKQPAQRATKLGKREFDGTMRGWGRMENPYTPLQAR